MNAIPVMRDGTGTQFSNWLRQQDELHTRDGYTFNNLDFVYRNWKTNKYCFIEEKRELKNLTYSQYASFKMIHDDLKQSNQYKGFYIVRFKNKTPEDGDIYISRIEDEYRSYEMYQERRKFVEFLNPTRLTSRNQFIQFLQYIVS